MAADWQFEISVAGALDERVSIQAILESDVELQLFPVGIDDGVRGENAGRRESGAVLVHPSDEGVVVFGKGWQGKIAVGGIHGGSGPLIVEGYHIHFFPSCVKSIIGGDDRGAAVGYRTVLVGPANKLISVFGRFWQFEFLAVDIAVANFCGSVHQHQLVNGIVSGDEYGMSVHAYLLSPNAAIFFCFSITTIQYSGHIATAYHRVGMGAAVCYNITVLVISDKWKNIFFTI